MNRRGGFNRKLDKIWLTNIFTYLKPNTLLLLKKTVKKYYSHIKTTEFD
jgi:hypothetical protein